jgi:hypothetical protein
MNDLPAWFKDNGGTSLTPPPSELPGAGVAGTPSSPLPGSEPLTDEQRARAAATDAEWVTLALPLSLAKQIADAILFMNSHPELVAWANEYGARVSYVAGEKP